MSGEAIHGTSVVNCSPARSRSEAGEQPEREPRRSTSETPSAHHAAGLLAFARGMASSDQEARQRQQRARG